MTMNKKTKKKTNPKKVVKETPKKKKVEKPLTREAFLGFDPSKE